MIFVKTFLSKLRCARNDRPLKIRSLQCYEVLWIHNIDAICTEVKLNTVNKKWFYWFQEKRHLFASTSVVHLADRKGNSKLLKRNRETVTQENTKGHKMTSNSVPCTTTKTQFGRNVTLYVPFWTYFVRFETILFDSKQFCSRTLLSLEE